MAKHDNEIGTPIGDKWSRRWLEIASAISLWSKDPSTRVGAVVVDDRGRLAGAGFNGFPAGVLDDERLFDREAKYKMVVHAEANALLCAGPKARYGTIYTTHIPCCNCMGLIIGSGISRVVFPRPTEDYMSRWSASVQAAEAMACEAGVQLRFTL